MKKTDMYHAFFRFLWKKVVLHSHKKEIWHRPFFPWFFHKIFMKIHKIFMKTSHEPPDSEEFHNIFMKSIKFLWNLKKVNILFLLKKPTTHFFLKIPPENNNTQSHHLHQPHPKSSKSRKHCKTHVKNAKNPKKCSW